VLPKDQNRKRSNRLDPIPSQSKTATPCGMAVFGCWSIWKGLVVLVLHMPQRNHL
jgi:hypothetical protein